LEVDSVLLEHPKLAEAICFAVPDAKYGEEVHAAIVPKEGTTVTETEIEEFAKSRLSVFKVPKRIYIADKLPRTATGKLQRKHIAEFYISMNKNL
jgi:oxalate---CoA ligase